MMSKLTERIYIALILTVTLLAYSSAINNDFITGWDDGGYLFENKDIQDLNWNNIKSIFSSYEMGNYHPFTILTYAVEYTLFGHNPLPFHINNIILHLINTLLVFHFIRLLTANVFLSFMVMFLFGVHTMHVESVAWISERKDVLYTCFFLLSLIFYLKYRSGATEKKKLFYTLSLLAFLFSVLSKGMAVCLSLVLVLVDILQVRKFDNASVKDKIPFFAVSFIFGIISVVAQDTAIQLTIPYNYIERFQIVNYSIISYLYKLLLPLDLCGFYPYPPKPGGELPDYFWLFPLAVLVIIGVAVYSLKRQRKAFFALGFFAVTVFLVLQIIPVGGAYMADRYAYVPSIGFFLLLGYGLETLTARFENKVFAVKVVSAVVAVYGSWLAVRTFKYCEVWKNNLSFYSHVLERYPTSTIMLMNRGGVYMKAGLIDLAFKDFQASALYEPNDDDPYLQMGLVYHKKEKYREAISNFSRAIALNDKNADAFNNRASAYATLGIEDSALADFDKAIALKATDSTAIKNRALLIKNRSLKSGNSIESLTAQINEASNKEGLYQLYYQRGMKYFEKKEMELAMADLNRSIQLNKEFPDAYYNRGIIFANKGNVSKAIVDYKQVLKLKPDHEDAYQNLGVEYGKAGKLDKALEQFAKVLEINPKSRNAYFNCGFAYNIMGKKDLACENFKKAADLGHPDAIRAVGDFCR